MTDNNNIDISILSEVFLTPSQTFRAAKSDQQAPCAQCHSASNEAQGNCNGRCEGGTCSGVSQ